MKTEHLAPISRTVKQRQLLATQRYRRLKGGRWAVKLLMLLG